MMQSREEHGPPAPPIYSILPPKDNWMQVNQFVLQVKSHAEQLRQSLVRDDLAAVRQSCEVLSLMAGGYGFPGVGDAAVGALRSLDRSESLRESQDRIDELIELCERVRAGSPRPGSP